MLRTICYDLAVDEILLPKVFKKIALEKLSLGQDTRHQQQNKVL